MNSSVEKTGENQAVRQRSLVETYHPNGERVFEYTSETHTVRITSNKNTSKNYTAALLRKLCGWLEQTPDPWQKPESEVELPF